MIAERYTLFGRIPLYQDEEGRYAADPLWAKDLRLHLRYIEDFRICCPVEQVREHDTTLQGINGLTNENVIPLRRDRGWGSVLRNLLPNARVVRRALSNTRIAHSGGAGWAFPLSYYILPLRPFLRFKWIIVIESSFFRMPARGKVTLRRFLSHHANTALLKACVRAADARIFTSTGYRDLFLGHDGASHVAPAIWVDEKDIVSSSDLAARQPTGSLRARLLFPARLIPDKGVQTVLEAIGRIAERHRTEGVTIPQIDIMGEGPLAEKCRAFAAEHSEKVVRFLDPVPYGAPFFSVLRRYDAVIVANLQDEQPRIVFDAFSQGLPCVASETGGTRDLVTPNETGVFFTPGDVEGLADRLIELAEATELLHDMGEAALRRVAACTHENMHRAREEFLKATLSLSATHPGWRDDEGPMRVAAS